MQQKKNPQIIQLKRDKRFLCIVTETDNSGTYFRGLWSGSVYLGSTQTVPGIHGYMWVIVICSLKIVLALKK